jgi:trehalose 6-phosphate synthase/phosphatase
MKNEKSKRYGAIVSENMPFMGTRSIVKVNSFDSDGIFKALNQINGWNLNNLRLDSDLQSIKKNNVERWFKSFVSDMRKIKSNDSPNKMKMGLGRDISIIKLNKHFKQIKPDRLYKYFKNSKSRLLIFNCENTPASENIQNFENNILSKRIVKIISSFCSDPNNIVFIISKYDHKIVQKIFENIPNLGICGDNGFIFKYPESPDFIQLFYDVDNSWRETALKIMKMFSERTEGSKVIESKSSITFSYQNIDNYFGFEQADELKSHLSTILNTPNLDIVTSSSGSLEIKPKNVNKGAFLARILQDKYSDKKFDLIFIIGCDDADEEMFKYLKSAVKYFHNFVKKFKIITATIGKHISKANYYFNEINDCIENLEYIIKERNKEIGEHGIYSYNRRESSQENEKEKNGKNTPIFNFHDDEDEK